MGLDLDPELAKIVQRVDALRKAGHPQAALQVLRDELPRHAESAGLLYLAGQLASELNELPSAREYCAHAIALDPRQAAYHHELGIVLGKLDCLDEAESHLRHSLELLPDQASVLNLLALLSQRRHDFDAAEDWWTEALEAQPGDMTSLCNWANMLKNNGRGDEAAELLGPAAEMLLDDEAVQMSAAVAANYAADLTPEQVQTRHRRFGAAIMRRVPADLPRVEDRLHEAIRGQRRFRVGYLSPDFRNHSVASFLLPILRHHDRSRFEVFGLSSSDRRDEFTTQFQGLCEHWHEVAHLPDSKLVPYARDLQLDLLLDCGGLFNGGRPVALAQRMAPIQAHYIGYPNTLGLPAVDYRFVDALTDPLNTPEDATAEKLLRLDGCFLCYTDRNEVPLPSRNLSRPLTFGSFNALSKWNAHVVATWAKILNAVPEARLMTKSGPLASQAVQDQIAESFSELGCDPDRLQFYAFTDTHEDHLAMYGLCDIALDTFPYNGTTTTCEALWMGTPVVSLRGDTHAGRVGVSLLSAIDRQEWLADDLEGYAQKAIELASDRVALRKIHDTLRQQMRQSPLMDAVGFTKNFERQLLSQVLVSQYA